MIGTNGRLAIEGGPKEVTAAAPESWLHGTAELGSEEIGAVTEVLRSKVLFRYAGDPAASRVARFESLFAASTGIPFALALNSGTSALIAGLVGLGVGQGDEVLVPAYTYIASAAAVLAVGALPVLVEVDESLTMSPADLTAKITPRTRAILPVHMRGTPCAMAPIMTTARERRLAVLEDVAQANGGSLGGKALGTFGDAGAFSLQHYKIMAAGEGGVLVTGSKEVHERAAIYHDSAYAFWMERQVGDARAAAAWKAKCFLGENYRMSELHGAVAIEQLKKRDRILARTRSIKARLWEACAAISEARLESVNDRAGDCGISLVFFMPDSGATRRIAESLAAEGVHCGTVFSKEFPDRHIYYHWDYVMEKRSPFRSGYPWTLEHRPHQVAYTREMCPRTIDLLERAVVLPIAQTMSDRYVGQVAGAIAKVGRGWRN